MARVPVIGLASAAVFFVLDQLVKRLVVGPWGLTEEGMEREVTSFFLLRNVHNHGVSLGFLQMGPDKAWVLIALTGAIAVAVVVWMWRETARADQVALGMIAGGALGNILDRVRLGYVQDYANLHFGTWEPFLNFNLADAAITIGVLVLLARALLTREKPRDTRADVEISDA
ncbi:MAG: signal peptidase II [Sphingomonas sp.]|uniref:signal peptidase II n=1 Tax=Sphingomonas sp. TaxID=28214 RepID=UPI001ACAD3F6|nr:signal peptidase II [Sphingomonas sp.]MBN8807893.1 signal peptidase II [Sphingomonas sp.]